MVSDLWFHSDLVVTRPWNKVANTVCWLASYENLFGVATFTAVSEKSGIEYGNAPVSLIDRDYTCTKRKCRLRLTHTGWFCIRKNPTISCSLSELRTPGSRLVCRQPRLPWVLSSAPPYSNLFLIYLPKIIPYPIVHSYVIIESFRDTSLLNINWYRPNSSF